MRAIGGGRTASISALCADSECALRGFMLRPVDTECALRGFGQATLEWL